MPMQRDLYPDDVTLLPCPFCGSDDVRAEREAVKGTDDLVLSVSCGTCHALVQEWGDKAIALWNTRVSDPRVAALEAQLADARDWSSTLADAADDLRAELREAERELAAIKARRCETCRHCKQWTTSDGEPRAACTRLSDAHKVIEFVVPERDGCSRWQDKEAANAER